MRLAAFAAVLGVLLVVAWPTYASSFRVWASHMKVSRHGGKVRLEFPRGIRAMSSDGYTVTAGGARIVLSSSGFRPAPDTEEGPEDDVSALPALPRVQLSGRSISLIHFFGRPVLHSPDYEVCANTIDSTDVGDHWTLAGEVHFRRTKGEEHEITGQRFVFDRSQSVLTTRDPIAIAGFSPAAGKALLSADQTVVDLVEQRAILVGHASFQFRTYCLDAGEMDIDLAAAKLVAPQGGCFRLGESELHSDYVVVTFEGEKTILEVAELTGRVRLQNVR